MKYKLSIFPLVLVLIPTAVLGWMYVSFSDLEPLVKQSAVIVVAQGTHATPEPQVDGIATTQFEFIQAIKGDVPAGTNSVAFQEHQARMLLGKDLPQEQRVVLFLNRSTDESSKYISVGNSVVMLPIRPDFDLTRIHGLRPEKALLIIARDYLDSKETKSPELVRVLEKISKADSTTPLNQSFQLQPSLQLQPAENDGIDTPDRPH